MTHQPFYYNNFKIKTLFFKIKKLAMIDDLFIKKISDQGSDLK